MAIRVQIPTPMRQHTESKATIEVSGAIGASRLLDNLVAKYPGLLPRLFLNGQVRQFVNLYLNDEDIRYLENLDTPVKDGDELAIIPAVAGG